MITAIDVTAGNIGDAKAAPALIADEPAGTVVLGDSAYGSDVFRADLRGRKMPAVIKPHPLPSAVPGGFTLDDFHLAGRQLTCPAGVTVTITAKRTARFGTNCERCPLRSRRTTSDRGRTITLHRHHRLPAAARRQADTDEFADIYRQHRPMVERTLAWFVRNGHRKVRYRGIERNRIAASQRAAAINLQRLVTLGLRWTITTT